MNTEALLRTYIIAKKHGELDKINKELEEQGIDPKRFWKTIAYTTILRLIENKEYEKAKEYIKKLGDLIDEGDRGKLLEMVYYGMAHSCGERADYKCLDTILGETDYRKHKAVLTAFLEPIIKNPEKYTIDVLRKAIEYCRDYGLDDLADIIKRYIDAGKYAQETLNKLKEGLKEISADISKEIDKAISSGKPEKIEEILRKYPNLLRNSFVKDNITLYDYLEAIKWYYENIHKLRETYDRIEELEDTINKYIENKKENPEAELGNDPSQVEGLKNELMNLINTKEYHILLDTGLINEKTAKALQNTIGFIYFAEALAYLDKGDKEKARELVSLASQYNPEYKETYYLLEMGTSKLTIGDLACIIDKLGLFEPVEIAGKKPPAPGVSTRPTAVGSPVFTKPVSMRRGTEHVPE